MKAVLYNNYPFSSVLTYNASTILHFLIGGLIISYSNWFFGATGTIAGLLYIVLSIFELYVLMPFQVCKNCVYFRLEGGLCVSGLNLVAKKIAKKGDPSDFPKRAEGLFCPNNLYVFSLVFPILCGVPILILDFSFTLLFLESFLFVLLIARFFFIIPRMACVHCLSKFVCPQAGQMGVREK